MNLGQVIDTMQFATDFGKHGMKSSPKLTLVKARDLFASDARFAVNLRSTIDGMIPGQPEWGDLSYKQQHEVANMLVILAEKHADEAEDKKLIKQMLKEKGIESNVQAPAGYKRVSGKNVHKSKFAFVNGPDKEDWHLPIHDEEHARKAVQLFSKTKGIPASAKKKVAKRIARTAKSYGIDTTDFEKKHIQAAW